MEHFYVATSSPTLPINVVHLFLQSIGPSNNGGLGDVAGALPKALARRGHRVMVVALKYGDYSELQNTGVYKKYKVDWQFCSYFNAKQYSTMQDVDLLICYFVSGAGNLKVYESEADNYSTEGEADMAIRTASKSRLINESTNGGSKSMNSCLVSINESTNGGSKSMNSCSRFVNGGSKSVISGSSSAMNFEDSHSITAMSKK
ncbi:hypothetical protein HYC85_021908 [Camellia sinensis]|uniref:Starch synthase catalytic domain-containing protein n=1 Tax=Camellia sinensis TaxID=4442 RepID=A0A7J7GLF9_CAMSI|nr:hypothetical protein HYC85_021908 [Camellia sinensis]